MARDLAEFLRQRHRVGMRVGDDDVLQILEGEGISLADNWPLTGSYLEVHCDGWLAVRQGLPRVWKRWVMIHGLIHHIMNDGNQLCSFRDKWLTFKEERRAELVTGWFFLGPLLPHIEPLTPVMAWDIAEAADVPAQCVHNWWQLALPEIMGSLMADTWDQPDMVALRQEHIRRLRRARAPELAMVT